VALLIIREVAKATDWIEPRSWPDAPDLPADRLASLKTSSNDLSVFSCQSEVLAQAKIDIAVALRAKRDTPLRDFDCVVIPIADVEAADFQEEDTVGKSADDEVNKTHYDIRELTARRLVDLLALLTPKIEADQLPRLVTVDRLELARALLEAERLGRVTLHDEVRRRARDLMS